MFCPSCGKEYLDDRNFCNSCGTNLASIKQILTGSALPLQPQQLQMVSDPTLKTKRKFMTAGFFMIGGGIIFAITMAIITDMLRQFSPEASRIVESLIPFCSIFFIVGTMLMIYAKMMMSKPTESQQLIAVQTPQQTPPLQQRLAEPPRSFTGYMYTPPSVTECTTAELKPPPSFKVGETD